MTRRRGGDWEQRLVRKMGHCKIAASDAAWVLRNARRMAKVLAKATAAAKAVRP